MTVQPLNPGARGIDYSGARPDPDQIHLEEGRFVIRYSAGAGNTASSTQWKLCSAHEVQAALAAGLDVIANSEWYESRITEGAAAGAADGKADLIFWQSRGLAPGASIYCSWDADPVPAKWPAVDAYLAAYDTALGGRYHVDCYAGTPYLKHAKAKGLIRYGWRPNAGSWSNDGLPYQPPTGTWTERVALVAQAAQVTPAHIWQTGNYWFGKNADEDLIVAVPVGSHLDAVRAAAPAVPVKKPPKPPKPDRGPYTTGGNIVASKKGHRALIVGEDHIQEWLDHDFQKNV